MRTNLFLSIPVVGVLAVLAIPSLSAQQHATSSPPYTLTDLGPIGPGGQVVYISKDGLIAGAVEAADGTAHATLFYRRQKLDISKPGFGGANSLALAVN